MSGSVRCEIGWNITLQLYASGHGKGPVRVTLKGRQKFYIVGRETDYHAQAT